MVENTGYDHSADMWCLGVRLYEFIVALPPFEAPGDPRHTLRKIQDAVFDIPKSVSSGVQNRVIQEQQSWLVAVMAPVPKVAHPKLTGPPTTMCVREQCARLHSQPSPAEGIAIFV